LTTVLGEFDIIARYFAPLANDAGSFELSNDAAVVDLAAGERLVVTLDTLVEGVHYLADDPPGLVARKLLRVNLSDLAAMGARPRGYLLSTALTAALDEAWLGDFTAGLAADQELYSVTLRRRGARPHDGKGRGYRLRLGKPWRRGPRPAVAPRRAGGTAGVSSGRP
jgi:thiamine monophosphate kinase